MRYRFAAVGCLLGGSFALAQTTIDPAVNKPRLILIQAQEKATEKTGEKPDEKAIPVPPMSTTLPKLEIIGPKGLPDPFANLPDRLSDTLREGPTPTPTLPVVPGPDTTKPPAEPPIATEPPVVESPHAMPPSVPPPPEPGISLPDGPHAPPIRYINVISADPPSRWSLLGGEPREGGLGNFWGGDEFLLWWTKSGSVPPLATRSRFSPVPTIGDPNSSVALGGGNWGIDAQAGYRTSMGWSVANDDRFGVELVYLVLGTRSTSGVVGSPWLPSPDFIARPYRLPGIDPLNPIGPESALPVNIPGQLRGGIAATLSTRSTGAEVNTVASLISNKQVSLAGTVGYRYFQLNEGLRVDQESFQINNGQVGQWQGVADQIDAHNRFHGGQLGMRGEYRGSNFFLEVNGKVALGTNTQTLVTSGQTLLAAPNNPFPLLLPGGFLVQQSNNGRLTRSPFAVLPEVNFRIGLYDGDRFRVFVGYNFLYLSDAVRPGDQIDRTINLNQLQAARTGVPLIGPNRPLYAVNSSDVWLQGLMFGFETRY